MAGFYLAVRKNANKKKKLTKLSPGNRQNNEPAIFPVRKTADKKQKLTKLYLISQSELDMNKPLNFKSENTIVCIPVGN